jgi:hypothetical protein
MLVLLVELVLMDYHQDQMCTVQNRMKEVLGTYHPTQDQ